MTTLLPSTYILSSTEIELHYKRPLFQTMTHITGAKAAVELLRNYINPKQLDLRECFWVLLLTNANRVLGISEVATDAFKTFGSRNAETHSSASEKHTKLPQSNGLIAENPKPSINVFNTGEPHLTPKSETYTYLPSDNFNTNREVHRHATTYVGTSVVNVNTFEQHTN